MYEYVYGIRLRSIYLSLFNIILYPKLSRWVYAKTHSWDIICVNMKLAWISIQRYGDSDSFIRVVVKSVEAPRCQHISHSRITHHRQP
jgi:hypothetical protein